MLVIDDNNYYLIIGRDAESTIESLGMDERITEWIKDLESHTNEECKSIFSYSTTNEEMLNYVYGHTKSRTHNNRIRRILSDSILISSSGVSTENENGTKRMSSIAYSSYMLEEKLFGTTCSQNDQALPGIKVSSISIDNQDSFCKSRSGTHDSVPGLGQYVDYYTVTVTTDSGHGSLSSQTQDTSSMSNELPTDSESVFTSSVSEENCIGQNIESVQDLNACESDNEKNRLFKSDRFSILSLSEDDNTSHDPSSVGDQSTTGVYHCHDIDCDDVTVKNTIGLQLI